MRLTIHPRFHAVVFAAAAIALFSARSADAQVTYTNKVMGSNGRPQCLAVKDGRIANSSPLIIWDCIPGDPSQTFTVLGDGTLRIGAPGSQYCVAAYDGVQRGTRIGVWQCQPGHPTQTLSLGMYLDLYLVKSNPTLCLGVRDASRTPGATIIGWDCSKTGNDNQAWSAARAAAPAAAGNAPAPAPPAPPAPRVTTPAAAPAPVASADPGMASAACQRMFGRDCSSDERSYLLRTTNNGPAYPTRDAMENYLRGYIANTPVIRDAIIMRASELTYGPNRSLCTEALNTLRASFGAAWVGLYQLYYGANGNPALIQSTVTSRCGANAAGAVGQQVDPSIAQAACQRIFGRNCSNDELADLTRTGNNAPLYPNRESMEARLADTIAASPAIKDTVIQSAFAFAMQGRQLCTEEMNDLRARFNRSPQAGNSWNGFYGLAYAANGQPALVQARASLCVAPAPTKVGSTTLAMVAASYQSDFGRAATTQETTYWAGLNPADPRIASRSAFQANNRGALKTDAALRQATYSKAIADTLKRNPTPTESAYFDNVVKTNGTTYEELAPLIRSYAASNSPAGSNPAVMTMIANQYVADFGRNPTDAERAYWAGQLVSDSRIKDADAFHQANIAYLKTSAAERQKVIISAYRATWGVSLAANSKEVQAWDAQVAKGAITYSGVKRANDLVKAANPGYVPGQALKAALKVPANYGVQSFGDDLWRLPLNFVLGTLNTAISIPFTVVDVQRLVPGMTVDANGPPPPDAATGPGNTLPAPTLRSRPQGLFTGPFIIAATHPADPTISMCLDRQSWNPGTPVVAARCHGGDSQLLWIDGSGRLVGYRSDNYNIVCIDAAGGKKQLVYNTCSSAPSQRWYTNTIPGHADGYPVDDSWDYSDNPAKHSSGQIQNIANGYCIDIQGGSTADPSPVIAYDCLTMSRRNQRPWNQIWGAGHFMQTGGAYVFFRYNPAPVGAGHVGWAVQLEDGSWEGGGVDGHSDAIIDKGTSNGAIRKRFPDEASLLKYFGENNATGAGRYDRYWRWPVSGNVNTAAVFSLESQAWDWGYGLFGNNCLDLTYSLLRAYGFTTLYKPPSFGSLADFAPSVWFKNVMKGLNTEAYWLHGK